MPAPTNPHDAADLARQLKADAKREAVASPRGYDWQKWLTVEQWIGLTDEDTLWIEFGEDITRSSPDGVVTIQAKDLSANITLATEKVRGAISNGFERDARATTIVWTSAAPGVEQGNPLGEPGIKHWGRVAEGSVSPDALRSYLGALVLSSDAMALVSSSSDAEFLALVRRIKFVTNEPDLPGLRERVVVALENRLPDALGASSVIRGAVADALFAHVAKVGALDDREARVLRRVDLDAVALSHADRIRTGQAPRELNLQRELIRETVQVLAEGGTGAGGLALQLPINDAVAGALQNELMARYRRAFARTVFEEVEANELVLLGAEVVAGAHNAVPSAARREILLRASRSASLNGLLSDARTFLSSAKSLPGQVSDKPAAARLLEAEGDIDGALRALRDETDPDSFSTLLSILARSRGSAAAVAHFDLTPDPKLLTSGGYQTLVAALDAEMLETRADALLQGAPANVFDEQPQLLFLRGMRSFASIFEDEARPSVLSGLPIDVRSLKPNTTDEKRRLPLDRAIADFRRLELVTTNLGLPRMSALAASYATWAELLHPDRRDASLDRLRKELASYTASSLILVPFAFAFDPRFTPDALAEHLRRQQSLGGWGDEEFRAATAIAFHDRDPQVMLAFLRGNRKQLTKTYGAPTVLNVEVQALAYSGQAARARSLLTDGAKTLPDGVRAQLDAVVGTAEGDDPIARFRELYESAPTNDSLRALLQRLFEAKQWEEFAVRAEELHKRTGNLGELADAARALARISDDRNLARLVTATPSLLDEADILQDAGWAYLRLGRFQEARQVALRLAQSTEARDFNLEISIAIGSGQWDMLAGLLPAYLEPGNSFSGEDLIRAARISQALGQGPLLELVDAAVAGAPTDPDILASAYALVLEEGAEDERPQAAEWFRVAVERSGDSGPIRRVDLGEMIEQTRQNIEVGRKISSEVLQGTLPLMVAARGLGRSQVEVTLGNLIRNDRSSDRRHWMAVTLFSGNRMPSAHAAAALGLDISCLLTLQYLRLLPILSQAYTHVVVAVDVMDELFESQSRLRSRQKTQSLRAEALQEAFRSGRLGVVPSSRRSETLDTEVGSELADLLRAAKVSGGVVVRPPPVHKAGDLEASADLSGEASRLSDMQTLFDVLLEVNAVTIVKEQQARQFFDVQCPPWPTPAALTPQTTLYLDGLAISYLQSTGLLAAVLDTFPAVLASAAVERDAQSAVAEQSVEFGILDGITTLRNFIGQGIRSGFVQIVPASSGGSRTAMPGHSTVSLLADLRSMDAIAFDDRAVNWQPFAADAQQHRIPLVTTLDILEDLAARAKITKDRRNECRMVLRRSGAVLVPLDAEEIAQAALRNRQASSQEFSAIQQSLNFARAAEIPSFPADIPWLATGILALKGAVERIWQSEDTDRAITLSNQVVGLRLGPREWDYAWKGATPPEWVDTVTSAFYAGLALSGASVPAERQPHYFAWVEDAILEPLRRSQPDRYERIVRYIAGLLKQPGGDEKGGGR